MSDEYAQVVEKATQIYEWTDPEGLIILLYVLGEKKGHVKILACYLTNTERFKIQADMIIKTAHDTREAEILKGVPELQGKLEQKGLVGSTAVDVIEKCRGVIATFCPNIGVIFGVLPYSSRIAVFEALTSIPVGITEIIKKIGPGGLFCALLILPVGWETLRSVYLWWRGEIDRKRAVQNVVKTTATSCGSFGATLVGAAIGTSGFGPVGTIIGGIFGGIYGGLASTLLTDMLTDTIFDLAPTQALQDAYNYLGISHHAWENEVISAYRKRTLIDHPDKPTGSNEAFCKLRAYTIIICTARGFNFKKHERDKTVFESRALCNF